MYADVRVYVGALSLSSNYITIINTEYKHVCLFTRHCIMKYRRKGKVSADKLAPIREMKLIV